MDFNENNQKIKCDVKRCSFNHMGEDCELSGIKVTCGDDGMCTRCGSFKDKE